MTVREVYGGSEPWCSPDSQQERQTMTQGRRVPWMVDQF
jgi:hypothetical protein